MVKEGDRTTLFLLQQGTHKDTFQVIKNFQIIIMTPKREKKEEDISRKPCNCKRNYSRNNEV